MSDDYAAEEGAYAPEYPGAYDGTYPGGDGTTGGGMEERPDDRFAPQEAVWRPLGPGDFDAEATMSTPMGMPFAGQVPDAMTMRPGADPLAAPGHGHVPHPRSYDSAPPLGAGQWSLPGDPAPDAAEQWSVPFAPEDPAEESGEFSVGMVIPPPEQPVPFGHPHPGTPDPGAAHPDAPRPDQALQVPPADPAPPEPGHGFEPAGYQGTGYGTPGYGTAGYERPGYEGPGFQEPGVEDPGFPESGFEEPGYAAPGYEHNGYGTAGYGTAEPAPADAAAESEPLFAAPPPDADDPPAGEDQLVGEDPLVGDAPQAGAGFGATDASDALSLPGGDPLAEDVPDPHSEHPVASYSLMVNGTERPVTDAWLGESLLYVLRERLGLAGAKDGCEQGECGACSVQVDGRLVASCLMPAATAAGLEVRTVEGLADDGQPSDVQRALAECGAVQCGFCVPGFAMTVHDLLEGNHRPTELETRQALSGNLCRCSGYQGVLDAVAKVITTREAAAGPAESVHEVGRVPHQFTGDPDGATS